MASRSTSPRDQLCRPALCLSVLPLFSLSLLPLTACSTDDDETAIDVVVTDRDPGLPDRLERIEVRVFPVEPAGQSIDVYSSEPEYQRERVRPWSVRVRPRASSHAGRVVYSFRAVGFVSSGEYVNAQARLAFVPGRRLVLPLRFEAACVRRTCPEEQTCAAGSCVDSRIDPCFLASDRAGPSCAEDAGGVMDSRVEVDQGAPAVDAFVVPDAGPAVDAFVTLDTGPLPIDGGPMDSGPADVGPTDAGPTDLGADAADARVELDACVASSETCNGRDDDCDGVADDGVREMLFEDRDDDGYGDPATGEMRCPEGGWVENDDDCYDGDHDVRPGQTRYFTTPHGGGGFDYDCDGDETLEGLPGPTHDCRSSTFCPAGCAMPPYDDGGACGPGGWNYGATPRCGEETEYIECECDGVDLPVSDFCCDGHGTGDSMTLACR